MKRRITTLLLLSVTLLCGAQATDKLTTNTILDMMQRQQTGARKAPSINGDLISAFVKVNDDSAIDSLRMLGAKVGAVAGDILTARIPVDALQSAAALSGVSVIESAKSVSLAMDTSRVITGVDRLHGGEAPLSMPLLGKGVVVGDIDAGLDFGHPAFYTSDRKTLRIKKAWLQTETAGGTTPAEFGYGQEYTTEKALLAKKSDYVSYSHSSHVLGIAAGADTTYNNPYYGIARESDIIFSNFDNIDTGIANAMKYIFNYADSVQKPAVINMSLGTQMGPHDGTSLCDQMADRLAGPGRIFVGAAGNEALVDAHMQKTFTSDTDTLLVGMAFAESLGMPGTGELQLWGEPGKTFKVRVCTVDKTTWLPVYQSRSFTATRSYNGSVVLQKPYDQSGGSFDIVTQTSPLNNRPTAHITLQITDYKPEKVIAIMVTGEAGSTIHGWANHTYCCFRQWNEKMQLPDNHYMSAEIGGSGKNVITVGAYVTKPSVITLTGDTLVGSTSAGYAGGFTKYDIAPFSNHGPSLDGRMKPDITAPGSYIVSALNSNSYSDAEAVWKSTDKWNNRQYSYGAMQGTSMAAPHVAGIIATWLEADPSLTPDQIRDVLKNTAIKDKFTGPEPNNTWGYGKIDAYAGLVYILNNHTSVEHAKTFTDPWKATVQGDGLHVLFLKPVGKARISVYTTSGVLVRSLPLTAQTTGSDVVIGAGSLGKGIYVVRVQGGDKDQTFKYLNK